MESPTDDEPIELTNGYFYWQGIQTSNLHPPLSRILQALPIRFLAINHQTPDADQNNQLQAINFFFNTNQNEFELMTMLGRWITLIFGLGIGLLLFIQTRVNRVTALAVLTLWAFEPALLAYSGLCLADIPVTFFFLAAVLAFKNRFTGPNPIRSFCAGILTAMAVGCKFSALALIPFSFYWNYRIGKRKTGIKMKWRHQPQTGFGALLVLLLLFVFYTFLELCGNPATCSPWFILRKAFKT